MKVVTVVGARPQFIKAAPVSKALRKAGEQEFIIHTGQHYDYEMSRVFFEELGIPEPDENLQVGSGPHGWQTGQMIVGIEQVLLAQKPDWVIVYGDTNSTLAGALAAVKLHVPVAHIEAGLRSFNREMPEEHNRVLTDHCSASLFCPTETAVNNLKREGVTEGVSLVGDVMYDAVLQLAGIARSKSRILHELKLTPKEYFLATVHRASNTDNAEYLRQILNAFLDLDTPVVFPVHPRTRQRIADLKELAPFLHASCKLKLINPVSYLDMLILEENAQMILTDSGGIQKEAFFFSVPCVTLRHETEWVETVESGWNTLAGVDHRRIVESVKNSRRPVGDPPKLFGDGKAAEYIVEELCSSFVLA